MTTYRSQHSAGEGTWAEIVGETSEPRAACRTIALRTIAVIGAGTALTIITCGAALWALLG